jgi:hypothetical protein
MAKRKEPVAPVTVTRRTAREIPPAFYESLSLTLEQVPIRLRGCSPAAVAVAYRLAGGDSRPGKARPEDQAWDSVQIDSQGHVYFA